jgi:hypothetical protein
MIGEYRACGTSVLLVESLPAEDDFHAVTPRKSGQRAACACVPSTSGGNYTPHGYTSLTKYQPWACF